jgi:succinate-semialdehyde dehydrogenase/glutarate-semialdehyde dehydrogenase
MTDQTNFDPLVVVEKATGKTLDLVAVANAQLITDKIARSRRAKPDWARLRVGERTAILRTLRARISSAADELSHLISQENGKPCHESLLHEVVPTLETIDWLIENADAFLANIPLTPKWLKHRSHVVSRRPRGVTAILSPFNFPFLISAVDSLTALTAGCSAIIAPSAHCPLSAARFVALAHASGIPSDVLSVVQGGASVGAELVGGDVDAVVFTGSYENGRKVAVQCAQKLIACTLELGGNCPLVVLNDANLERTARAIVFGALSNSGQSCLAVGRVLVPRALAPKLADILLPLIRSMRQGDPLSGPVELGALTTKTQLERCLCHVTQATENGATRLSGGRIVESEGRFFEPTLLTNCDPSHLVYQQETFGPVIALCPYDDEATLVRQLNCDESGLAAYVFGSDLERAKRIAEKLDYAHVVIDHVLLTYVCPEVPLSGLRQSGLGTVHGKDGFLSHSTPQVLAAPKVRLPDELEFSLGSPERAEAVARTFLTTTNAMSKLTRFWQR